ncbi:alpha-L-fucosidase [Microlunatus elymi]|nr:alpha-L-fucosidase [Microlunatus elymi]
MISYQPSWESLRQHQIPDWFTDAKFGIWAHWGAQSVARSGDWYARHLYGLQPHLEDWEVRRPKRQSAYHREHYGPPTEFGYKDLVNLWKAEHFDADSLIDFYADNGARYFVSMASHCDNVDLWDSDQHPWNTTRVGPGRNIVAEWAKAARRRDLPFGLSFHQNWTWRWLNVATGNDPETGEPFDGRLTAADGVGTWWEGLDPIRLYGPIRSGHGPAPVEVAEDFYRRLWDAVSKYEPELVYLDDSRMPFDRGSTVETAPPSQLGLKFLSDYYRRVPAGIAAIKDVPDEDRTAVLLDSERRQRAEIETIGWQLDTSDGEWFDCADDTGLFRPRKNAPEVLRMLIDVVSKNGSLLLNVPQLADGTLDEHARRLVTEIGDWLRTNGEGIYGSRPWLRHGEGPNVLESASRDEKDIDTYTAEDYRFTQVGEQVYAFGMARPSAGVAVITSLGTDRGLLTRRISSVTLLGHGRLGCSQDADALRIKLPEQHAADLYALRISTS